MIKKTIFLICTVIFMISCSTVKEDQFTEDQENNNAGIKITSEIWADKPDSYIRFYTNDPGYTTINGATYWKPLYIEDMTGGAFEISANKVSGNALYGYGMIFCIQDDYVNGQVFTAKNFYALLIRIDGSFQIIKTVNRKQYPLQIEGCDENFWKTAKDADNKLILLAGLNLSNRIKVIIKDSDADTYPEFEIYFNDIAVLNFEESFTSFKGETFALFTVNNNAVKKAGYIVTLGPNEDFPATAVDVYFKHYPD